MKVALINPNSPFLINERVFPNIGLVRVATQLRREGHEADIIDLAGKDPSDIKLLAEKYDRYGFSATSPQMPYVSNLARILREADPAAKTILGGAHASALYQLRLKGVKDVNVDDAEQFNTIFAGEGENTSNMFRNGWQKGEIIRNIDDTAIPDRSLIDLKSYHYDLFGKDTTTIQTQRGCPQKCSFCSGRDVDMYKKVRAHSPARVLEELDKLNSEYGYTSFMWYDDEININPSRLEKICEQLATRPYQHRGFVRSDGIVAHPESVKWLKEAGFVKLCSGVESGSNRILKRINKGCTIEDHTEARRLIGEAGIHYEAFMLVGHPGEEPEDVVATYEWLKNNNPDDFDVNVITPYPGSKIYDDAIPSTIFRDYKWEWEGLYFNKPRYACEDSFYKGQNAQSESNVRTKEFTNLRLRNIRDNIERGLKNK